jgi:DNA invertase Pin-like site-specific DNA recombinase
LFIDDVSRLSRRCDDLLEILEQLEKAGIKLALVHPPSNVLNEKALAQVGREFKEFVQAAQ